MALDFQPLGVMKVPELAPSADARFYAVLRDSISDGMKRVLGAEGTRAILYHLDLPSFDDPKKFHERLTEIFGFGTAALENVILQQLHQSMGVIPALAKDDDFVNQVELAKRRFDETARRDARRRGETV
jgi:hypothetical protein